MKRLFVPLIFAALVSACGGESEEANTTTADTSSATSTVLPTDIPGSYAAQIQQGRDDKNSELIDAESGILEEEVRQQFEGLPYFKIDENYKVKARLVRNPAPETFEMVTTTDRRPEYITYGTLYFELNGESLQLEAYRNLESISHPEYGKLLFVPFNDPTNGNESYGGGRFMDLEVENINNKALTEYAVTLDFNTCYNPYCAYNHKYSCPVPPAANNLSIPIFAGEKAFDIEHH